MKSIHSRMALAIVAVGVLFLASIASKSIGQAAARPQRWEYKTLDSSLQASDAELTSEGQNGWELVSVTSISGRTDVLYVLKRAK